MLSSADIEDLRSSGLNDDQIIDGVKKIAPQFSGDIDNLRKDNVPSSFILQHIDKFQEPAAPGKSLMDRATDIAGAVTRGVGNEFHQLAGTTRDLGGTNAAGALDVIGGMADGLAPQSYKPSEFHVTDPSTYGNIPEKLAGAAPGALATMGAGAAGTALAGLAGASAPISVPIGILAAGGYGAYKYLHGLAAERAKNNGRDEVTSDDLKGALPGALASGAIDALALKGGGFLGKEAASVPKAIASQAVGGGVGSVVQQTSGSLGTDKGWNVSPGEVADASALSGIGGGLAKAAGNGLEAAKDLPLKKFDPEFFNQHAEDVAGAYGKTTGEKVKNAAENAKLDYKEAIKPLKAEKGAEPISEDVNAIPQSVQEAHGAISRGSILTKDDIAGLKEDLASHHNADEVISALGRMNEANKLASTGNNLTRALEATGLVRSADPNNAGAHALMHFGSVGGALWNLAHGNPVAAGLSFAAPIAAKVLAKAADKNLGLSDPVGRWQARYGAMKRLGAQQASQAPSTAPQAAQPWGPVEPMPTTGSGVPATRMAAPPSPLPQPTQLNLPLPDSPHPAQVLPQVPDGHAQGEMFPRFTPNIPPEALALAQAQAARANPAQAPSATPVATQAPVVAPEAPVASAEPLQLSAKDPASRAELLKLLQNSQVSAAGSKNASKQVEGKTRSETQTLLNALATRQKAQSASSGTSEPNAPNVTDLIPIEHSEGVRMQPAAELRTTVEQLRNGIEVNNSAKRATYAEPVEGLSASEQSQWKKLVADKDAPFRSQFSDNGLGGHGKVAMEAHVRESLTKHGLNDHQAQNKIVRHLEKHHWFKTFGHKKK